MSNVFLYDEIFSNFNWKNVILIYENNFSWDQKNPNSLIFELKNIQITIFLW